MSFDLYYAPAGWWPEQISISGSGQPFAAMVYYPTAFNQATITPGTYPLVVFAHGDRTNEPTLCPADIEHDYRRWSGVLGLWARCGFVVVAPDLHDILNSSEETGARLAATIGWMRGDWVHREVLFRPSEVSDVVSRTMPEDHATATLIERLEAATADSAGAGRIPLPGPVVVPGWPTATALVGHSWGARGCAIAAAGNQVSVSALVAIAGSWDENAAIEALVGAGVPTLLMAGGDDFNSGSLRALWSQLPIPRYQAVLQGVKHWDWFGTRGGIQPCDPNAARPSCTVAWQVASELILGLLMKQLDHRWYLPPYLLGPPGGRPALFPWFEHGGQCAVVIRWHDPTAPWDDSSIPPGTSWATVPAPPYEVQGEVTLGSYTDSRPW